MKAAHIFISGFVQGIGFRQFIKRSAEEGQVTGWVRNLPDGRVEAVLQGAIVDVEKLIMLCEKGPFLSAVKDIKVIWEDINENFESFEIVM